MKKIWVWEFKSCHQGVLQKKMFLKIQQNLHESTCGEYFFKKKTPPQVFPKRFFEIWKKTFSPGDCFWKFTSPWLLSVLFKITGLKHFANFQTSSCVRWSFSLKNYFFLVKPLSEITLSRVFFNTFFRINPRKVLWIYFEKGTLKRTQDGLVLSWVNSEKGTLKSTRTAQKVSKYGVLSGYYFINLRIQSEYQF